MCIIGLIKITKISKINIHTNLLHEYTSIRTFRKTLDFQFRNRSIGIRTSRVCNSMIKKQELLI